MFELTLICDERRVFEGKVRKVDVQTESGAVAILPGHQPYMAKIEQVVSYVDENGARQAVDIESGFVYTNGEKSFVVVDLAAQ